MRGSNSPWWSWWFKWWIIAAVAILILLLHSGSPQMWFWLVMFLALILYAVERAING